MPSNDMDTNIRTTTTTTNDDDDDDSETRSLTDSIRQHVVDGNLRYHAYHQGTYAFPNDETEQSRFHGMDLSPIQPDWVPENVEFFVDDFEDDRGWGYAADSFDYIHVRHTTHSIKNRPQLWKRIYEHLKPGGYVEVQEFQYVASCDDASCDGPYAWRDFLRYLEAGLGALGSDLNGIRHVEPELLAAGFGDVSSRDVRCPLGPWPEGRRARERGRALRDAMSLGLVGLARRPLRDGLGWSAVQIEMFLVDVRKDLVREAEDGRPLFHSYFPFRVVFARKPVPGEAGVGSPVGGCAFGG
ncbi:hypothetical protein CP533_1482 [Ophiocordyceps camponoti-saundersi (nom. inval.)]|nr:hypothetical protein CP533_1482 [Ophiocordyceps camponoti-saundersi (nom. inval.)]